MLYMLLVVWGVALLALVALGAVLLWTLRGGPRPAEAEPDTTDSAGLETDTLLLYYEDESVRHTPRGDVVLRIPGNAWEHEWQEDLVRLEVARLDPSSVSAPEEWGEAQVLTAYDLRAHRMTEIGTDIEIEVFSAPIDVFLISENETEGLRFGMNNGGTWTLAPLGGLSGDVLEQARVPVGRGWAAASISQLRQVCLVRVPPEP
jgi:hypothetical protein